MLKDKQEKQSESGPSKKTIEVNAISLRLTQDTQLERDEFIIGVFEDGFFPGQVIQHNGKLVCATFMKEVTRKDAPSKTYWKWPSPSNIQTLDKDCLLEIRPNIDVSLFYQHGDVQFTNCTTWK